MKRFIYEVYYTEEQYHDSQYWEADSFREAKKQIKDAYASELKSGAVKLTMIAEIKFEDLDY